MPQFKHDEFAKDLLRTALEPYGTVVIDRPVINETRRIDVFFTPAERIPTDSALSLLWQCAAQGAAFEPFRSPVRDAEIRSTMGKLFDVHSELARTAHRTNQPEPKTHDLPRLWIITPTLSAQKLKAVNAITDPAVTAQWGQGIYLLGDTLRTGIIVVHHLPKTPETAWFRTLGRGRVQQDAINEIATWSQDHPYRQKILELFTSLQVNLANSTNPDTEERKLLMALTESPAFIQYIEQVKAQGVNAGTKTGYQTMAAGILAERFGTLDPELNQVLQNILDLPPTEIVHLLMTLSRQELLDTFTH